MSQQQKLLDTHGRLSELNTQLLLDNIQNLLKDLTESIKDINCSIDSIDNRLASIKNSFTYKFGAIIDGLIVVTLITLVVCMYH